MKNPFRQIPACFFSEKKSIAQPIRQSLTKREGLNIFIVLIAFWGFTGLGCTSNTEKNHTDELSKDTLGLEVMLKNWADTFVKKVDSAFPAIVNFRATDHDMAYHVSFSKDQFNLYEGLHPEALFTFEASQAHYNKIYRQEITGFTSMGRENMTDSTPLDVEFHQPMEDHQMNDFLFFVQRFFNPSPHDKVVLSKEHSRIVHGGHAIPLFYQQTEEVGVRSAWYKISKGQQVNEPGDTNPFPQYFIVTRGKGFAKIGNDTLMVKENEAYYIAPGLDHVFWNESETPLEMIFLAWGKGA